MLRGLRDDLYTAIRNAIDEWTLPHFQLYNGNVQRGQQLIMAAFAVLTIVHRERYWLTNCKHTTIRLKHPFLRSGAQPFVLRLQVHDPGM
jgi:hypothetical protein